MAYEEIIRSDKDGWVFIVAQRDEKYLARIEGPNGEVETIFCETDNLARQLLADARLTENKFVAK